MAGVASRPETTMLAALAPSTRSALNALTSLHERSDAIQNRLATGKRVATPTDSPTNYYLAAGLDSRARDIEGLMTGISDANGAVATANNGVASIRSLLKAARAIANRARFTEPALLTVIGARATSLGGATAIASTSGTATKFQAGDTVTVSDGAATATYTAANGDTAQTFLNAVNNAAALKVSASLTAGGQIRLDSEGNVDISVGGSRGGLGTIESVLGLGAGTMLFPNDVARVSLATQFDALRTQINAIAADSAFNGVNLLGGGSSTINFNERGTASLTIAGAPANAAALGLAASTNSFQFDSDIDAAISSITTALTSLQSIATKIGAMSAVIDSRSEFNRALVNTLQTGRDDLIGNDANADGATLLALQARQQIATTALSLSRSGETAVLRLFDRLPHFYSVHFAHGFPGRS